MAGWRFEWRTDWSEVWQADLMAVWQGAFAPGIAAHRTPFQHPAMVRAWIEAQGGRPLRPFLYRAWHPDGRQALQLLVGLGRMARRLEPAGGALFDYGEPLVLPGPEAPARLDADFWAGLRCELERHAGDWFDVAQLGPVRARVLRGAEAGGAEESAGAGVGAGVGAGADAGADWGPHMPALLLPLDAYADFDAYTAGRSKRTRKGLRVQARLAEAEGPVAYVVHEPSGRAALRAELARFAAFKRARLGAGMAKGLEALLDAMTGAPLDEGLAVFSTLRIGDRPAALEMNLLLDRVLYGYFTAYDPALERFSPGRLHLWRTVEWAFARELRLFDMLRGEEGSKSSWTDGDREVLLVQRLESRAPSSLLRGAVAARARRLMLRLTPPTQLAGP